MFSIISRMSFIAISWGFLMYIPGYNQDSSIAFGHGISSLSVFRRVPLLSCFFHCPDFLRNPS